MAETDVAWPAFFRAVARDRGLTLTIASPTTLTALASSENAGISS